MITKRSADADRDPIALLVVHGIGSQRPGETLNGLLKGMRSAYGDRLGIRRVADDHAILNGIGRPVHIFEVFWADLLQGEAVKGTFDFDRIFEVVWLPLLNHGSGRLSTEDCPRGRVLRWTCCLVLLSSFLSSGLLCANFLAAIPTGIMQALKERKARLTLQARVREFWQRRRTRRTILDDLMDEVVGDLFNYVDGVARAFPEMTARNRKLVENVDAIHARFLRTAERAAEEGCEEIQVLAHSLGTVAAFLAMCPQPGAARSASHGARLSRFYTIGSPLEKVRFFWTRLIQRSDQGPAIVVGNRIVAARAIRDSESAMKWDNFFSRLDLVSGRLERFSGWPIPTNHRAAGLGGLISSHVAYNRNPGFLTFLGEGLTGEPSQMRVSLILRLGYGLLAALENLMLPLVLFALAVAGLAIIGGIAWLLAWPFSQSLEWLDLSGWARGVRIYFVASTFFTMTVVPVLLGRGRARELYALFWAPENIPGEEPNLAEPIAERLLPQP